MVGVVVVGGLFFRYHSKFGDVLLFWGVSGISALMRFRLSEGWQIRAFAPRNPGSSPNSGINPPHRHKHPLLLSSSSSHLRCNSRSMMLANYLLFEFLYIKRNILF